MYMYKFRIDTLQSTMMIFFFLALCFTAAACLPTQQRIINGSYTTIDQYPFTTAILMSMEYVSFRHICGGTIINNRSVLSAAHCFVPFTTPQIRVRVGSTLASSGGNVHVPSVIINHPDYSITTMHSDISILRVSTAFSFGPNIQVGSISGSNYNPGDNEVVWAAGWGYTSSDGPASEHLQHVQIRTVSQSACAAIYGSILQPSGLCAGGGGRGVCFGDSGGPLIHNNVIIGVPAVTNFLCGSTPAIFTRVSSFIYWIQAHA